MKTCYYWVLIEISPRSCPSNRSFLSHDYLEVSSINNCTVLKLDNYSFRPDLVNVHCSVREQLSLGHPMIVVMDSLGHNREAEVDRMRAYLGEEWERKEKKRFRRESPDFTAQGIKSLHPPNLPRQPNGVDCGIYTIEFAERSLQR